MTGDEVLDSHPNAPRRGPVFLAFGLVVIAGVLGALIGYGLVHASCSEHASKLQQLLDAAVRGYRAREHSCQAQLAGATMAGALLAAIGAGIVAVLVLRAMTDWRSHPPSD